MPSKQRGLPSTTRMRHDHHFVDQLAARHTEGVGQLISIDDVMPNPNQPRRVFEAIGDLVASIKEVGLLEPLLVRRATQGYQIISGERRYRAAVEAGLAELPCMVLDVDEAQVLTIALIENLQREDLTPFEEADGLRTLIENFNYTHEEVARKIGKARTSVTEILSLGDIPDNLRESLSGAGVTTRSILLEVARVADLEEQATLVARIVDEGLTRDQLRALRRGDEGADDGPQKQASEPTPSGRRITYRSGTGITLTLYLARDEISVAEIQETLREAIAELDPGSSE